MLVPLHKGSLQMPRKTTLPAIGERVNGWEVLERLADEVRTGRHDKRTARFRVRCTQCPKELELRMTELPTRQCTDCLRAAPAQAAPPTDAELAALIIYAYRVRLRICAALGTPPVSFDEFEKYYRAHPEDLLEASPNTTAADYEQRNYSPLYTNTSGQ